MSLEERFWSGVQAPSPDVCWPWTRGRNGDGYGVFYLRKGELEVPAATPVLAHRMAFFLEHGRWPNPQGLHGCDNPLCCNAISAALHVHEGTQSLNLREACQRGRRDTRAFASSPSRRKLDPEEVDEIRSLYEEHALSQEALAVRFQVGQSTISRIVRRRVLY